MKLRKQKIKISLLSALAVIFAVLFASFNFTQAASPLNEVIGQVTLDGLPADGASVVLTDASSTAFLTDIVGVTGSSSISGYYYFDLSNLSIAPIDGDVINIDVTINSLIATTSFVFDSSIATVTPESILIVTPDVIAPVITLIDSSILNISQYSTFVDPGATALDNIDGDVSGNIIATGTVDTAVLGQYMIVYSVTDIAGNTASTTRTVNVGPDVVAPVISLIGSSTMNVSLNSMFSDPGASALDDVDGDVTANIMATGTVDTTVLGQYILIYTVMDTASNTASTTREVNVILDIVPPVINLNGSANINIAYGGTYAENGAIWTDDVDGAGSAIVGGQSVNTNVTGTYIVAYNYSDSSGNPAIQVTRSVVVGSKPSSGGGGGGGGGSLFIRDNISPGVPTNVRVEYIENLGYKLTWINPSDSDFNGIRIVRKTGSAPTNIDDGIMVFENRTTSYVDISAQMGISYYYGLASYDKSRNFSNLVILNVDEPNLVKVLGVNFYIYEQYTNLYGLSSSQVEDISLVEAQLIFDNYLKITLSKSNQILFDNILKNKPVLSEFQQNVLANFVQSGSPTTLRLGSGERAGVAESFANAFGRLPSSLSDYQDVVKIANGRWTTGQSIENENKAKESFKQVYKRSANTANANDNNALKVMAYGLRPVNRNMNSERASITTFKDVYKHSPVSTSDWDIMRAVAYSGTKR